MNRYSNDYGVEFQSATNRRPLTRQEAARVIATPLPKRTTARLRPAERHAMAARTVAVALVVVTAWVAAWIVAFAW